LLHAFILLGAFYLLSSLWALAEAAFPALDRGKVKAAAQEGNRRAAYIKRIINEMGFFQSIIRMASAITWVVFGALALMLPVNLSASFGIIAGGAIVALFLGNALKTIAITKADTISAAILLPLRFFLFFLSPLMRIITILTNALLRRWGVDLERADLGISEDDIRHMVNRGGDVGSIDAAEQEMINNIFEFNDKSALDIAIHRMDIVAIDAESSREEIIDIIIKNEYSRYPVYEETIDNIIGILYTKEILTHIFTHKDLRDDLNPRDFIKDPYIVPPSKKIDEIFNEMRQAKVHMAIVVDEYGGCEGLLTVEDLVEEIVGNIYDEYDEVETPDIEQIGENKYMIQGAAELEDVADTLGITLPEEEYDTFGGFIVHLLGRIPNDGEKPSASYGGYLFQIYEVREKRIQSVFVEKEAE